MSDLDLLGFFSAPTNMTRVLSGEALRELSKLSLAELITVLTSTEQNIDLRYTAGFLLSIFGDPRINTFDPCMCEVPGGHVMIGLKPSSVDNVLVDMAELGISRDWILKETPQHTVKLSGYRIGRYCVTNQEFLKFIVDTGTTDYPTSWRFGRFAEERANHPAHTLTATQASQYCEWLSNKTGRTFRLPTEAEWEFAASGIQGSEYPWGGVFFPDHANTAESGILDTTPVGAFPKGRSWCGAEDMAGNVEEIVADLFSAYPGGPQIVDDLLKQSPSYNVARGGSFSRFRDLARTRRRHGHYQRDIYIMGFRLAESRD